MKKYFFLLLGFLGVTGVVFGQQFNKTWGFDGGVFAIEPDGDYIYVAGRFDYYGPIIGHGALISKNNVSPAENFPVVNGTVTACAPDGNGGWYIGGSFTKVGDFERKGLAQINADGSVSNWDPQPNGAIEKIVPDGNVVYVCGYFTSLGGTERHYLAKLNRTDGSVVSDWDPSPDWVVHDIVPAGKFIFVAGEFQRIGQSTYQHRFLAKIRASDGTLVTSFFPKPNQVVRAIALRNGSLYVGGDFTSFWGVGAWYYAAKIDTAKGDPVAPFWKPNPDHRVTHIAIDGDRVFLAGEFTQIGTDSVVQRQFLAEVGATEGKPNFAWKPDANNFIENIKINDGMLYVVGQFREIGGERINYVARLDEFWGAPDHSWIPNADGTVTDIAFSGDQIYLGGTFQSVGGISTGEVVRLNKDDFSLDKTWLPQTDDVVNTIAVDDQNVFIGGAFKIVNQHYLPQLAKLNKTNGDPDPAWTPLPDGEVNCMISRGDTIILAGNFTKIGVSPRDRIAMVNKTNGEVFSWAPTVSGGLEYGSIGTIDEKNGYVYAAGRFYNADRSVILRYFRRISVQDATEDPSWMPDPDLIVRSIHIHRNDLFAAGNFSYIGGLPIRHLAKLDLSSGAVNPKWQPNPDGDVQFVTADNDYVYVTGNFDHIGTTPIQYFARLDYNTAAVDPAWDLKFGSSLIWGVDVTTVGLSKDKVLIGGIFNHTEDRLVNNFTVFTDEAYSSRFPSPPSKVEVVSGSHSILLKWHAVLQSNIEKYNIYISTDTSKGYHFYTSVTPPDTVLRIPNLNNGSKYFFRITAVNFNGDEGPASNAVVGVPNLLSEGLVAFYPFTNGSGADSSGHDNNGILHGVVPTEDRFGQKDAAFYFNGKDAYIDCGNDGSLQPDTALTVTGWMFLDLSVDRQMEILSNLGIFSGYDVSLWRDKLEVGLNQVVVDSIPYPVGEWVFFATTFRKGEEKFYLNGTLSSGRTKDFFKIKYTGHNLQIGHTDFGGNEGNYFEGKLDDIRIYNRELSQWEIKELLKANGWEKVVPQPPQNVRCSARIGNNVTLSWAKSAQSTVNRYDIYMTKVITSWFEYVGSVPAQDTSWTVNIQDRANRLTYFTVAAVDNAGRESCFSDTVLISPQMTLKTPTPVFPLQNSPLKDTLRTIPFKWSTVDYADFYRLQLSENADFSSVILDTLSAKYAGEMNISLPVPLQPFYWRVQAIESCNQSSWSNPVHVTPIVTSVASEQKIPKDYFLSQNYPNPFGAASNGANKATIIKYGIPAVAHSGNPPVVLEVFDVLGRKVATLVNRHKAPGMYAVKFNAAELPSGIYFYKFKCGTFVRIKKMILMQ